jgi:hypothetical protein
MRKADVSDLRTGVRSLAAINEVLPARQVGERAIQHVEMLRLSAGINRRFPCNLAESPCIFPSLEGETGWPWTDINAKL